MVAGLSEKNKAVYAIIKFGEIVMVNNGKNESIFTMELENLVVISASYQTKISPTHYIKRNKQKQ